MLSELRRKCSAIQTPAKSPEAGRATTPSRDLASLQIRSRETHNEILRDTETTQNDRLHVQGTPSTAHLPVDVALPTLLSVRDVIQDLNARCESTEPSHQDDDSDKEVPSLLRPTESEDVVGPHEGKQHDASSLIQGVQEVPTTGETSSTAKLEQLLSNYEKEVHQVVLPFQAAILKTAASVVAAQTNYDHERERILQKQLQAHMKQLTAREALQNAADAELEAAAALGKPLEPLMAAQSTREVEQMQRIEEIREKGAAQADLAKLMSGIKFLRTVECPVVASYAVPVEVTTDQLSTAVGRVVKDLDALHWEVTPPDIPASATSSSTLLPQLTHVTQNKLQ